MFYILHKMGLKEPEMTVREGVRDSIGLNPCSFDPSL